MHKNSLSTRDLKSATLIFATVATLVTLSVACLQSKFACIIPLERAGKCALKFCCHAHDQFDFITFDQFDHWEQANPRKHQQCPGSPDFIIIATLVTTFYCLHTAAYVTAGDSTGS